VRIVIGDPAELILHPVDALTKAAFSFPDAVGPKLSWEARHSTDVKCDGSEDAHWDAALGGWKLRAAAGEISVILQSSLYQGDSYIQLVPGSNEAQLFIDPMGGVVLLFEVDGNRVDAPGKWRDVAVTTVDGTPVRHHARVLKDKGEALVLEEPAEIEVVFPEFPGFERPESFRLQVGRGEWIERTVSLVRRH
jgi:hypothetical protein